LTGKNQVTVPAEIARKFDLHPGSKLDWSEGKQPGTILIRVQPSVGQLLKRAQELGSKLKNRKLVDELVRSREDEDAL
jgi:AbrB family looped-hinge helix DNA binding protein